MDHLSSSQITQYLLCPRKYKIKYIDGIEPGHKSAALAFGSAVHTSLAYLAEERKKKNGINFQKVISTFRADWQAQMCDEVKFKEKESEGEFLDKGISLLKEIFEESKDWNVSAAELPFSVPIINPETGEEIVPVPLNGFIDLVLEPDKVIEYKTGIRKWDSNQIKNNIQVSLYHYAYELLFGRAPQTELKILLRQKKTRVDTLPAERTKADICWTLQLVREVYESIIKGAFHPNPGWLCSDCEFADICRQPDISMKGGESHVAKHTGN